MGLRGGRALGPGAEYLCWQDSGTDPCGHLLSGLFGLGLVGVAASRETDGDFVSREPTRISGTKTLS